MTDTAYRVTLAQLQRLAHHKSVSGPFVKQKGLWEGRNVAVVYMLARGTYNRRTEMRIRYGTLVLNDPAVNDQQIAVRSTDGELHVIHVKRAKEVHDMTRTVA